MDTEFFAMGGYAYFVWLSYGLSAVVLLANAFLPARKEQSLLNSIAKRAQGNPRN
ncbi:MAG: heme exporter protein D [Gammaproteobacteria bacterium]|jgi:heme exporter protein D